MRCAVLLLMLASFLLVPFVSFADGEKGGSPRFDIKGYEVEGNTLIPPDKITQILAPFTGKDRDFATVREAAGTLQAAYRRSGFATVRVVTPEQELAGGIVRLRVVEIPLGKVKVEGNRFFPVDNIRNSLPGLREGAPPDMDAIAEELKLANENPAKKVNLQLQPANNEIDAKIEVKDDKPWAAALTADNTGDKQSGLMRVGASLQYANLFNRDHVATFQYVTSPDYPSDVNIYGFGYRVPFYSAASSLEFIGTYSDVNAGAVSVASSSMQVTGKGTVLGLHYNQDLPQLGNYEHKAILALDYRAYQSKADLDGTDLGNDVTVHPLSLTYAGVMKMQRASMGFYVGWSHNLPGGWDGRDTQEDFTSVRADAPASYTVFHYGAHLSYDFPNDWQVRLLFNGQYTDDPLVSGEQFGLGGEGSVRGFYTRQFANDRGYSGTGEIYTPDLNKILNLPQGQLRALIFYDTGHVWQNRPLPGEVTSTTISSFGPGLRFAYGTHFSCLGDWGIVVDPAGGRSHWGSLVHFAATVMF